MNTTSPARVPADLSVVVILARLLERLEHSRSAVDPAQYRTVVARLRDALQAWMEAAADDRPLRQVLDAHPAAAELYENMQYHHAGLCRSPMDQALAAEIETGHVLARASGRVRGGAPR